MSAFNDWKSNHEGLQLDQDHDVGSCLTLCRLHYVNCSPLVTMEKTWRHTYGCLYIFYSEAGRYWDIAVALSHFCIWHGLDQNVTPQKCTGFCVAPVSNDIIMTSRNVTSEKGSMWILQFCYCCSYKGQYHRIGLSANLVTWYFRLRPSLSLSDHCFRAQSNAACGIDATS